jgi:hypothetical protein
LFVHIVAGNDGSRNKASPSGAIDDGGDTALFRAMGTAEDFAVAFDAVSNDLAIAVGAGWRQHVNGALETVEGMFLTILANRKCFVILVPAHLALGHSSLLY